MTDLQSQREVEAHPLLYVLTLLVVINLVVTAWIALHFATATEPTKELPPAAAAIRDEAPTRIVDAYNRRDFAALYDVFDPFAKSQVSQEQVAAPFSKTRDALGEITSTEFTHYAFVGHQKDRDWYELYFHMDLSGGDVSSGILKITVAGVGDHFGIMRIDLRSE